MKKTVLKNMMNVLTCSVLLSGVLGAHHAAAALSGSTGDMVGFTATTDQYWTAPGDQVEFKIRLGGTFTASITNTFWAYPTIDVNVGGVRRQATFKGLSQSNDGRNYRTDLTFAYTVQAGDVAFPMMIWTNENQYVVNENSFVFVNTNGLAATWRINTGSAYGDVNFDSAFFVAANVRDENLYYRNIRLQTMSFDAGNVASIEANGAKGYWTVNLGGVASNAFSVVIWTPTNLVKFGETTFAAAITNTVAAGSTSFTFPIKGLIEGSGARIVVQRREAFKAISATIPSDAISSVIDVSRAGEPSARIEWLDGSSFQESDPTDNANRKRFKIVLNQTYTNLNTDLYFRIDVAQAASNEVNVVVDPEADGYVVRAGQTESVAYGFFAQDGSLASKSSGVSMRAIATNVSYYTSTPVSKVYISNVAPTIAQPNGSTTFSGWRQFVTNDMGIAWSVADVPVDLATNMVFYWEMDGTLLPAQTNLVATGSGSFKYAFSRAGLTTNKLYIVDKDGTPSLTSTFYINVEQSPRVTVSTDLNSYREITNSVGNVRVTLSKAFTEDVWVKVYARYGDGTEQNNAIVSAFPMMFMIPQGETVSDAQDFTLRDGTVDSVSKRITFIPEVTNTAAQAEYKDLRTKTVSVYNTAPSISVVGGNDGVTFTNVPVGSAYVFDYEIADSQGDLAGVFTNIWSFGAGEAVVTNVSSGARGTLSYTFTSRGTKTVSVYSYDKDGGVSQTYTFQVRVVQGIPLPAVTVLQPSGAFKETDASFTYDLTVQLSQDYTESVTVALGVLEPTNYINGIIQFQTTNVVFAAGQQTATVKFSAKDGTPYSIQHGFTVVPRVISPVAAANFYTNRVSATVFVENADPIITSPVSTDITTDTFAYELTQGVQKSMSWVVTDVNGDKITSPASANIRVVWDFGDGTSATYYGASGTAWHTYTAIEDFPVTVTAYDKDGGQTLTPVQFKVRVNPSKGVNVTPLGPNSASYWGATGLGDGMVKSADAVSSTNYNNVYRFRFTSKTTSATLDATPYKTSGTPSVYYVTNYNDAGIAIVNPTPKTVNSYFFVWEGDADVFANAKNLDPATATAMATIKMPASTDSTSETDIYEVRAIFSKEYRKGDGAGDINQDGIPDGVASAIFGKMGTTGSTSGDSASMPYWLTSLRSFNDDGDFLPANPTGIGGVYDFRPVAKGSGTGNTNNVTDAINAFNAYLEVRGYDEVIGLNSGVSDDPGTDPTAVDSDSDGYSDGWEYYFWYTANFGDASGTKRVGSRYNPRNISEGIVVQSTEISNAFDPMKPRTSWSSQYRDDFDNDGLLDIEEMLLGTNPTTWDTDNDIMCDGWEILMGLNPCDAKDGSNAAYNNIDGDYFAIASVFRQRIELVITNTTAGTVSTTTNVTTGVNALLTPDSLTNAIYTCYYYGNTTNSPLALGRRVTVNTNNVLSIRMLDEMARVLVLHFQVRDEFGFDPRTAWCDSVVGADGAVRFPLTFVAGSTPVSWPTNWPGQTRFMSLGTAPNTRAFTAVDEYLLLKFMRETASQGCPDQVYSSSVLWLQYSTHPLTPDTDATPQQVDGVPDGWELYVATPKGVGTGLFAFSPWSAGDRNLIVNDTLQYSRKFAGTDSVAVYTNAALYAAVGPVPAIINGVASTDVSLLSGVAFPVMTGVVSITRPGIDRYWLNKFWPCDPWQADTDNDGTPDAEADGIDERSFIYGIPVDDGSTCIAGGGLNPCAVDTDSDGLPDGWEIQFQGTVPALGTGGLVAPAITNGMDGTYVDFDSDWDADGLRNVEEYLTGAIRAWRFDRGSYFSDVTKRLDETYNAAYDLFLPCTNVWDKSLLNPDDEARVYWYMLPAAQMITKPAVLDDEDIKKYASASPLTADSDGDGMDDYYEVFHGLNPLLGNGYIDGSDIVAEAAGVARAISYLTNMNFMEHPFLMGMPQADPDADGLLNLEEALVVNTASSQNHHTDPSPIWSTDISNPVSVTRRFYRTLGGRIEGDDAASSVMWFNPWGAAPFFYFPFEMSEGYDTDNDGISDKDEIAGSVNTASDPLNFMSPYRRQALYFDGVQSAASTVSSYADNIISSGGQYTDADQAFKSFTVEMWICPERVNQWQTLIERNFWYDASDAGEGAVQRLRANYRIGIQPNGQLFAGFDNAGGHDDHTGVAKVLGPVLKVGEWRHVALRMDATTSRLVLYVDGAEYTSQDTDLIPANGIMEIYNTGGSNSFTFVSGWLTLGAKNSAPANLAISLNSNNIPDSAWAQTWGGFGNYYQGWMAEVRVWDGARTGTEIQDNYKIRFSLEEVRTARADFEARLAQGARRTLPAPNNLPALLMNYYPMCDLFGGVDASTVAMVPRGFDSHTVTDNQPDLRVVSTNGLIVTTNMVKMGSVQWWANTEVRSMVYTNRTYLPWIQNAVSHLPGRRHVTPAGGVTFGTSGSTMDSFYWTATTMGTAAVSNSFPNTANPYGFGYRSAGGSDLLPLGSAWMRQTTNFWDKQGASASWLESAKDSNNDGLADWWENQNYNSTTGAGGWDALYTGNLTEFQNLGLTNGQVYRRMLAQGWRSSADGSTGVKDQNYAQTADSDGDGLPDWWESLYGFDSLLTTGNDGAGGDPDGDGLSNLAEYLISEVYGFRYSNPTKFKTLATQEFSDYLVKKGKLPLGFIFTDHDFIEDAWEQNYSADFVSRFLYDAHADADQDGWSTYAERRYSSAVRPVSPEKRVNIMVGGSEISEFPIPTIKTTISYAGSKTNGNLIVQAFSSPDMNGAPDAKWAVASDTVTAGLTTPIGIFAAKTVTAVLSPGSLVPGTIKVRVTDMWTGLSAQTGFDFDGKLYTMPVAGMGYQTLVGTVDYVTGAVTFDMSAYNNRVIILDEANYPADRDSYIVCEMSYFEFVCSAKLASQWPQELHLGQPVSGYVKEGVNYFLAFLDANGSSSWDPGEPMGVATPFATNIGWDNNTLKINLTDYTPSSPRISITQMKRDVDGFLGASSSGSSGGGGTASGTPSMQRVRIRRSSADMTITPTVIFDKVLIDRDYIHEGDYLAQGGYAFDWNFKGLTTTFGTKYTNFVYDVYVGDGSAVDATTNVKIMSFTNILPAVHYAATPTAPIGGATVRSANPTFRWKMPKNAVADSYAAYCIQIKKGSSSGAVVWNSGTIRTPLYDRASGEYYFEAPVYMGSVLQPNTLYVWSVAGLNARYTLDSVVGTTASLNWSAWKPFRMESSVVTVPGYTSLSPVNGSDYGSVGVTVKYFGPATSLAGRVVVQAFTTRDFTGNPIAQATGTTAAPARGMTTASYLASLTNQTDSTSVNAMLYGLPNGTYYVRAFLDSNTNGVHDVWESWGYYNYAGMADNNIYDPRSVAVASTGITPVIMLAVEDCDTDQDFYPDAWEYEQNSAAENFLELTAPLESWDNLNDQFVLNNKLSAGGQFYNTAVLSLTLGSDDLVFNSVAADDGYSLASKLSAGLDPATSVSFAATGIALVDQVATVRSIAVVSAPTTATSARGSLLLNVMVPSQTTALQYVVQYTKSLAAPQWTTVAGPYAVDASGMQDQITLSGDIDATSGFFRIVPYNP